jgi:hypothetical protein
LLRPIGLAFAPLMDPHPAPFQESSGLSQRERQDKQELILI